MGAGDGVEAGGEGSRRTEVGAGLAVGEAGVGGEGVVGTGRTETAVAVRVPGGVPAGLVVGSMSAPAAAMPTVANTTRNAINTPANLFTSMALGKDPLAEILLLEWYKISSGEFLDQCEKVP